MHKTPYDEMVAEFGLSFPSIEVARRRTDEVLRAIAGKKLLQAQNTSLVLFGSVGRREFTQKSDLDWSLVVDGPADPAHAVLLRRLRTALQEAAPPPGETFGSIVSSHELMHHIGGRHDNNANLTVRMLMLLESTPINNALVHERVVRGILERYAATSASVAWDKRPPEYVVPRFLLNDFVRYWRTIAVDYAAKRWEQFDQKWAIRNAKLRMSRKLLFVAGLLICFKYELDRQRTHDIKFDTPGFAAQLAGYLSDLAKQTPIDILAGVLLTHDRALADEILTPYDQFLAILNNDDKRKHLETLEFDHASDDALFQEVRGISHRFQEGINKLFFDADETMKRLVRLYGVF
jgi:predicted nucleotidyltransferase